MRGDEIELSRVLMGGAAAGVWIVIAGMAMAAVFGYREMKAAFDAIGLAVPSGPGTFATHVAVRLLLGFVTVWLLAVMSRVFAAPAAILGTAAVVWCLFALLPSVVLGDWGLFPWGLVVRVVSWSLGELLVATLIGWVLYRR